MQRAGEGRKERRYGRLSLYGSVFTLSLSHKSLSGSWREDRPWKGCAVHCWSLGRSTLNVQEAAQSPAWRDTRQRVPSRPPPVSLLPRTAGRGLPKTHTFWVPHFQVSQQALWGENEPQARWGSPLREDRQTAGGTRGQRVCRPGDPFT